MGLIQPDHSEDENIVGKKYALLIGVEKFDHSEIPDILGVEQDIKNFGELLNNRDFSTFDVTAVSNCTLIEARRAISEISRKAGKKDVVFLYYSGMGVLGEPAKGSEKSFYLCFKDSDFQFKDATCMESEYILSQFRKSECENFIIIADTCYSGAFFNNNRGLPKSLVAFTASGEDQLAMGTKEGGVFTNIILQGLRSDYIDTNRDGKITFSELFDYISEQVSAGKSYAGTPKKWEWNVDQDISFFNSPRSVFISYQRKQQELVGKISASLNESGISTFVDTKKIRTGDKWKELLEKSIMNARAFIFVMDNDVLQSTIADWELEMAHNHNIPIFPIMIGEVSVSALFEKIYGQYNRTAFDPKNFDMSIKALINHIKSIRIKPSSTSLKNG
ncbi:TIR domain-containing protein [Dyadobacter sp. NIV53]|uniref:TIR domain-containing protein n=1 Tax=Dyadobacter sp. NIV53 TaxID=2861765 RepID=UPI001C87FB92|nr:TIR domain-containing protein [Dyadobacter sp. NIV53]